MPAPAFLFSPQATPSAATKSAIFWTRNDIPSRRQCLDRASRPGSCSPRRGRKLARQSRPTIHHVPHHPRRPHSLPPSAGPFGRRCGTSVATNRWFAPPSFLAGRHDVLRRSARRRRRSPTGHRQLPVPPGRSTRRQGGHLRPGSGHRTSHPCSTRPYLVTDEPTAGPPYAGVEPRWPAHSEASQADGAEMLTGVSASCSIVRWHLVK